MRTRRSWTQALSGSALAAWIAAGAAAAAGDRPLELRVNNATATPGGIAAVVVRTYESRPIGQGQICLKISGRAFARQEGSVVTSADRDALHRVQVVDSRTALVQFFSPSRTINAVDGPMVVFYLRMQGTVRPGQTFGIEVDALNTFLIDGSGARVTIEPDPGRLVVRGPNAPYEIEADGDEVSPGEIASLFMETQEPVRVSSGTMGMRFEPAVAAAPPTVRMGGVYGKVDYIVDTSTPGLVLVTFESPDASLNRVPGGIVQVDLRTRPGVPAGTVTPVALDPDLTTLIDRNGEPLSLVFKTDTLTFK